MGLAVYNSIILDIRFPPCCYKKLLSPAVVPYNNPRAVVGVTPLTITNLKQVQPVSLLLFNQVNLFFFIMEIKVLFTKTCLKDNK